MQIISCLLEGWVINASMRVCKGGTPTNEGTKGAIKSRRAREGEGEGDTPIKKPKKLAKKVEFF